MIEDLKVFLHVISCYVKVTPHLKCYCFQLFKYKVFSYYQIQKSFHRIWNFQKHLFSLQQFIRYNNGRYFYKKGFFTIPNNLFFNERNVKCYNNQIYKRDSFIIQLLKISTKITKAIYLISHILFKYLHCFTLENIT